MFERFGKLLRYQGIFFKLKGRFLRLYLNVFFFSKVSGRFTAVRIYILNTRRTLCSLILSHFVSLYIIVYRYMQCINFIFHPIRFLLYTILYITIIGGLLFGPLSFRIFPHVFFVRFFSVCCVYNHVFVKRLTKTKVVQRGFADIYIRCIYIYIYGLAQDFGAPPLQGQRNVKLSCISEMFASSLHAHTHALVGRWRRNSPVYVFIYNLYIRCIYIRTC